MNATKAYALVSSALIMLGITASVNAQERRTTPVCPRVQECLPMAKAGNMKAQTDLAYLYHHPKRVPTDKRKAVYWYRKAAEQGSLSAKNNLATLLMHNEFQDISNQKEKALEWWQKAAKQGHVNAQANLSGIYRGDLKFKKDKQKAFKWMEKAAKQGMPEAQRDIAIMYEDGYGVSRDLEKSAKWFKEAAKQGLMEAQAVLGTLYGTAKGVERNYIQSYAWLDIAAKQGFEAAKKKQKKLLPRMSESDLRVAEKLSEKYHKQYVGPYQ